MQKVQKSLIKSKQKKKKIDVQKRENQSNEDFLKQNVHTEFELLPFAFFLFLLFLKNLKE